MAIISFSDGGNRNWVVAGWAFRRVLDDASAHHPEDLEMVDALKLASDVGYLSVYLLEPALAERVTGAIRSAAADLLREPSEECVDEPVEESWRRSMEILLNVAGPSQGALRAQKGQPELRDFSKGVEELPGDE